MTVKVLKRNIFQRLFGIPATRPPADPACWTVRGKQLELDPARAPELANPGGALRLEGGGLGLRVLVWRGQDGELHAAENRCGHAGRRLDPVPGEGTLQCCSMGHTTYDTNGNWLEGPGKGPRRVLPLRQEGNLLVIDLG